MTVQMRDFKMQKNFFFKFASYRSILRKLLEGKDKEPGDRKTSGREVGEGPCVEVRGDLRMKAVWWEQRVTCPNSPGGVPSRLTSTC